MAEPRTVYHAITCTDTTCDPTCTAPVYDKWGVRVYHHEALALLRTWPDACVDAIVCDPQYGLSDLTADQVTAAVVAWAQGDRERVPDARGFMGHRWDGFVPPPAIWDECYRVLKPGGHLAAFTAARNIDIAGIAIRMAGFQIRESVAAWVYSQGMPKGANVSKAIDKAAGAEREVIGDGPYAGRRPRVDSNTQGVNFADDAYVRPAGQVVTAPATAVAREWEGWNTQLAPAHEPIILGRKPLAGTIAQTVLAYGTGGLHIDACRVAAGQDYRDKCASVVGIGSKRNDAAYGEWTGVREDSAHASGRWPSNVLFAHAPLTDPATGDIVGDACADGCIPGCQVAALDEQSGITRSPAPYIQQSEVKGDVYGLGSLDAKAGRVSTHHGDQGRASRFFSTFRYGAEDTTRFRYEAKAPKSERPQVDGKSGSTVKPLGIMRWIAKLLTPPGGTILDWCAGSGATGQAARAEGFRAILIDQDPDSIDRTIARLDARPRTEAPTEPGTTPAPADDHVHDLLDLLDGAS